MCQRLNYIFYILNSFPISEKSKILHFSARAFGLSEVKISNAQTARLLNFNYIFTIQTHANSGFKFISNIKRY